MPTLLFVYGTLKEGFPNHHLNAGRRVAGEWRTCTPWPLLVVRLPGEDRAPWLMDQPGHGQRVHGQVFEVTPDALAAMDRFEEVGLPTGYRRTGIELERVDAPAPPLQAWVYVKPADDLPRCLAVEGPFEAYTLALARGYWIGAAEASDGARS